MTDEDARREAAFHTEVALGRHSIVRAHSRRGTRGVRRHIRGLMIYRSPRTDYGGEYHVVEIVNPENQKMARIVGPRDGKYLMAPGDLAPIRGYRDYRRALNQAIDYVRGEWDAY